MIVIDNILVSEDVVDKRFVCDLNKCKGGCCEEGDAGAPVDEDEMQIMREVYDKVKHLLPADAIKEIDRTGLFAKDDEFGWVTNTIGSNKGICVFAFHDKQRIIKCAFEQAYRDGLISWKKPISCHGDYERVNYEPREVLCKPGCNLGEELKVPVYQFLKEPLIRKYGEDFYNALDTIAKGEWEEIDFKEK